MWVVRDAVHVFMPAMEGTAHVITLDIVTCQIIIVRVHAAVIWHALTLHTQGPKICKCSFSCQTIFDL